MDSAKDISRASDSAPIDYEQLLDSISEEDIQSEVDFIGVEPITIKTTNAQEIYNHYQMFPKILVFDLRSGKLYNNSHLKCSVNFPVDKFRDSDFINFDPDKIYNDHLELKVDKAAFKGRKRSMWFIVAHQKWTSKIFEFLPYLFDVEKFSELKTLFSSEDILATRNSILLYKALKKDKTREVYIWRNSFNAIQGKYPFMCRFTGSSIYIDPKKTNGYPSEILDRRLYLGDKTHAQNETIIHNLGITHILNVSDTIPNKFEESKSLNLTYHKINIEDNEDVPIQLSFGLAYDFIENAISPKKHPKQRTYQTNFDVLQIFNDPKKQSASLVYSACKTNSIVLDLGSKTIEDIPDKMKDKINEMDIKWEKTMHHSHNQNRVLVHWAMGRSRSATMVAMYLMKKFDISMDMSLQILKNRREVVDPNEGFLQKLREYEKQLQKHFIEITCLSAKLPESCRILSDSSSSSEDLLEKRRSVGI